MIQRPGLLHSLTGLLTALINIYTAQGGHWSVTAKITIIVISLCTGNMSVLYLIYNHWILEKMKTTRDRALAKRNQTQKYFSVRALVSAWGYYKKLSYWLRLNYSLVFIINCINKLRKEWSSAYNVGCYISAPSISSKSAPSSHCCQMHVFQLNQPKLDFEMVLDFSQS